MRSFKRWESTWKRDINTKIIEVQYKWRKKHQIILCFCFVSALTEVQFFALFWLSYFQIVNCPSNVYSPYSFRQTSKISDPSIFTKLKMRTLNQYLSIFANISKPSHKLPLFEDCVTGLWNLKHQIVNGTPLPKNNISHSLTTYCVCDPNLRTTINRFNRLDVPLVSFIPGLIV